MPTPTLREAVALGLMRAERGGCSAPPASLDAVAPAVADRWLTLADAALAALPPGALPVVEERHRQVHVEGWTADHDGAFIDGELSDAAACYLSHAGAQAFAVANGGDPDVLPTTHTPSGGWPWAPRSWKPRDAARNVERGGALAMAELARLDRAARIATVEALPPGQFARESFPGGMLPAMHPTIANTPGDDATVRAILSGQPPE